MKRAILTGAVALVAGAGALLSLPRQESFPHARHAGLFPVCTACHEGIESGDPARFVSVAPETCRACHDGQTAPEVSWDGPTPAEPGNLRTVHPGHPELPCGACHQVPGTSGTMEVRAAAFENCKTCHAPSAEEHLAADNDCAQCHLRLTDAPGIPAERIAAFPAPPSHAAPDFLSNHGGDAARAVETCAVCHARESCTACHANAGELEPILALEPDARVASLATAAEWTPPVPASHQASDWPFTHGAAMAESATGCGTCHTQETCTTCHVDTGPVIAEPLAATSAARIPTPGRPAIPGHGPNFAVAHGEAAVASLPKCAACHAESYCVDCHDGSGSPSFHPTDFVSRHGADAWSRTQNCSDCHSNEAFCRDCHATQGFAQAPGQRNAAFHDAQPDWFQSHGRAARQGLDACASCHSQSSCLTCHSAKEGFRINPHGPDFDVDGDKARASCTICHFSGTF
ncbi:MAG: hypothetical protein RRA92_06050 [Gemmatimonadota bacterium]|nr:hypothetical protein [Gemmatimonadota bacterium]